MYIVDHLDQVTELENVPQSSVGAPCPVILCGGHSLQLVYVLQQSLTNWDGPSVRVVGEDTPDETCALVLFKGAEAHMFGPPNDEAFTGHPLAKRGLKPYSVAEIRNSSWIRGLEKMNSVHPYHRKERYEKLRHFIFAFHDTTFECVAEGFDLSVLQCSVSGILRDSWPKIIP